MSTLRPSKLFLSALAACLLASAPAMAEDREVREKQLKTVLGKIEKLKQAIDVKEDSKSKYIKQLKSIERRTFVLSAKRSRRGKRNWQHCAKPACSISAS
jgi:septal ring factor EnvC (AmiA/AmiB activator)